jgi:hypothetical protein
MVGNQTNSKEESLLDFLQRCPIDEEIWRDILDRPTDPPREISFDEWRSDDAIEEELP